MPFLLKKFLTNRMREEREYLPSIRYYIRRGSAETSLLLATAGITIVTVGFAQDNLGLIGSGLAFTVAGLVDAYKTQNRNN